MLNVFQVDNIDSKMIATSHLVASLLTLNQMFECLCFFPQEAKQALMAKILSELHLETAPYRL